MIMDCFHSDHHSDHHHQYHDKNQPIFFTFHSLPRFPKTHELWSSKANSCLCFSLPSIILADFLANRTLLKQVQKAMVCDLWLVDLWIRFVYFCVSRFVACDLTNNNDRLQSGFFPQNRKEIGKAWRTGALHTRRACEVSLPVSLSVFSLVPDLLFYYSRLL